MTIRIGILTSRARTFFVSSMMLTCRNNKINTDLSCFVSDHSDTFSFTWARRNFGIPTFCIDYRRNVIFGKIKRNELSLPGDFNAVHVAEKMNANHVADKAFLKKITLCAIAEHQLLNNLSSCNIDLLVCVDFEHPLTPYFLDRFQNDSVPRVMKIYRSLSPPFSRAHDYKKAWESGDLVYGPSITFAGYNINNDLVIGEKPLIREAHDTFESFNKRALDAECNLYYRCIKLFAENRLTISIKQDGTRLVEKKPKN